MSKGAYINEEGQLVVDMAEADKLWNSLSMEQQFQAMSAMFDPLLARATEMKAALEDIAKQKKTDELETEYDVEVADFETGYDTIIDVARKALNPSS